MEQTPGSPTGSSSSSSPSEELKSKAQSATREAKGKAQQAAQRLKEQGKQQLESGKEGAAEKVEQLADAVNRASDELHQQQEHGLADYASQIASGISNFADTLRNRSVDDLIDQTQALARRNPTIFFLSSIGVGLAVSRFLKASARNMRESESDYGEFDVSYDSSSEWHQPEASQSIYGGQPSSTSSEGWSTESRGNDFEVRHRSEGGSSEAPRSGPNVPPSGGV